jgi:DNA invertase Pin-like site-specific DNA recombinase
MQCGRDLVRVIYREFVDVETAKAAGRTEFGNMLDHIASTGVRTILVEKTDRLYRNFRDYVTIDDLNLEVHLVKENEVVSRDSRSHQKFIHGIKVLMAKYYIDNLSEETQKGLAEKVAKGGYPHFAPVGYKNDKATRTIVVDQERAPYVRRLFEWYASGEFSIEDLHQRCVEAPAHDDPRALHDPRGCHHPELPPALGHDRQDGGREEGSAGLPHGTRPPEFGNSEMGSLPGRS